MRALHTGEIVLDTVEGRQLVVVADRGDSVLVSSLAALKPDATLILRAQWCLPRADLFTSANAPAS